MALAINKYTEWKAGEGTPVKYSVQFSGTVDLTNIRSSGGQFLGDVVLNVTVTIVNHPYNSQNSFEAADFALLSYGDLNPKQNYQFTDGQTYYGTTLPQPASLPTDRCAVEFRGDTFRPYPNMVSLWTANGGNVLSSADTEGTWTFSVSQTKTITLTGSMYQPILTWSTSGAEPNHVEWLDQETWFSYADFYKTLKYNANGGSGAPADQDIPISSPTFTVSNTLPTHSFWIFKGWADTASASTAAYQPGQSYPIFAGDTKTIYAVWQKDYRPGKTYRSSDNSWQSHNRPTGAANIRNAANTGWTEMRTIQGAVGTNNPPYIRHSSQWMNQRLIGEGGGSE